MPLASQLLKDNPSPAANDGTVRAYSQFHSPGLFT